MKNTFLLLGICIGLLGVFQFNDKHLSDRTKSPVRAWPFFDDPKTCPLYYNNKTILLKQRNCHFLKMYGSSKVRSHDLVLLTAIKLPPKNRFGFYEWSFDPEQINSTSTIMPFLLSKHKYALKHHLPFYIFNSRYWNEIPGRFHNKVAYVKYYLIQYLFTLGYNEVFWVDSDTMMPNSNVTLNSLRNLHFNGKKVSLMVQNGLWLNAGVFALRNTAFSQEILELLWEDSIHFNPRTTLSDQIGLQHTLIKLIDKKKNQGQLKSYLGGHDYCIGVDRKKAPNQCWVKMVYKGPLKQIMLSFDEIQLIPWASSTKDKPQILQCANIHSRYFKKQHCLGAIKPLVIHIGGHGHTASKLSPWLPYINGLLS